MEGDPQMGALLPEDVLADVLRLLPPRGLAASRCVCKTWRDIVDGRSLLLSDLLPHSASGIFLMYHDLRFPAFLSRPSTEPEILDKLELYRLQPDLYCKSFTNILDHRNGLLLYQDLRGMHVANPAVQRRAQLPPPPRFESGFSTVGHLLFDPRESPHYEVVLVPVDRKTDEIDKESRQQPMDESEEWPPSIWVLCVFSSRTGRWEERAFVQESESARITCHEDFPSLQRASSAYWRGAFFVLCNDGSHVLKLSLSNNAYRLIELPADIGDKEPNLGRSKEGVCCAAFHHWPSDKLQIWILDESCGKTEWLLKNHVDMEHSVSRLMHLCREIEGPWVLQDANNVKDSGEDVNNNEGDNNALLRSKFEWDSDEDNIVDSEYEVTQNFAYNIFFLGFHPFKDVIFLNITERRAVAYHLNTRRIQDLGKIWPSNYGGPCASIISSFVYTPCLIAELPENELEPIFKTSVLF